MALALAGGLLPFACLPWRASLALLPAALGLWGLGAWYKARIGGYTGDCLGAAQQVAEVLMIVSLLLLT